MSISKTWAKKSPSQNPVAFFKGVQQGGAHGKPQSVPDVLSGGPMRERVYGKGGAPKVGKA